MGKPSGILKKRTLIFPLCRELPALETKANFEQQEVGKSWELPED
jgi:hypothetical protein